MFFLVNCNLLKRVGTVEQKISGELSFIEKSCDGRHLLHTHAKICAVFCDEKTLPMLETLRACYKVYMKIRGKPSTSKHKTLENKICSFFLDVNKVKRKKEREEEGKKDFFF